MPAPAPRSPFAKKPKGNRFRRSLNWEEIRRLYLTGLSSTQVATIVGCGRVTVAKICRDIIRDRSTAAQLRQPMRPSTHWRTCRQQARRLTELELGRKLETREEVHHKDGDYTNQTKDNREVQLRGEHQRLHHPANPVPRHLRPGRRAYMKAYLERYRARRTT